MRDQHGGLCTKQQHLFKPRNPVAAQRALPVVLFHSHVAMRPLPPALPVFWATALPAGEDEDVCGIHCREIRVLLIQELFTPVFIGLQPVFMLENELKTMF